MNFGEPADVFLTRRNRRRARVFVGCQRILKAAPGARKFKLIVLVTIDTAKLAAERRGGLEVREHSRSVGFLLAGTA